MADFLRYDTVLWDIDDTLLDFGAAESYAFEITMKNANLPSDEEHHRIYCGYNLKMWSLFDRGEIKKEELVVERFRLYLNHIGSTHNPAIINEQYLNNLSDNAVLLPYAIDTLKKLNESGVRQYAITNAVSFVNKKRARLSGIDKYFEDIFVSEEIGFSKPDIRYYRKVFSKVADFNLEKTLAVGDSLSSDILGGNRAGLSTCMYCREQKKFSDIVPDYVVNDLRDIIHICTSNV